MVGIEHITIGESKNQYRNHSSASLLPDSTLFQLNQSKIINYEEQSILWSQESYQPVKTTLYIFLKSTSSQIDEE